MSRKNLDLPADLKELQAKTISQGECRFCNEPCDVVNIAQDNGQLPIVLHSKKACTTFHDYFTKPDATGCADQNFGIYKLG
jgi:hypothetical protein